MTKRTIEIKTGESEENPKKGNGTPAAEDAEVEAESPAEDKTTPEAPEEETADNEAVEEIPPEPTVEEKLVDMTSRLQRMAAEFENYKKKNAKEFERGHQAGAVRIIERLVPVLDSFDSAQQTKGNEGLLEGFKKIHQQMIEALVGAGLEIIEPEQGTPMNPHVHEVLMTQPTDEVPEDTVFATFQRGYSFNGWLVRPAKVQVAKKPEA